MIVNKITCFYISIYNELLHSDGLLNQMFMCASWSHSVVIPLKDTLNKSLLCFYHYIIEELHGTTVLLRFLYSHVRSQQFPEDDIVES